MAEKSAEEAANDYARAVLAGEMPTVLRYLTPEALGNQMDIAGRSYFRYVSYDVALHDRDGDDYLLDITYNTDATPMIMRHRFRDVEGAWKIIGIERINPPGAPAAG